MPETTEKTNVTTEEKSMATTADFTIDREKLEIVMSYVFDAPRELVFKCYTDPDLFVKWWGPREYTTTVDKLDVRPGGEWRMIQHNPAGEEFAFHGEHREVVAPERIVATFEFEGMPGHVVLQTAVFEDVDGKTRLTNTSLFESIEDLEGMVQSGMEWGARESWDRLAELVVTL
jgi:uncharacterized protein YndB with AHSA1/START domain